MSFQAMAWAVNIDLPPTEKLVVLMLANRSSNDDWCCWPSINNLAKECGCSRRNISDTIKKLEEKGILRVERSKKSSDENNVNKYFLVARGSATIAPGGSATIAPGSATIAPGVVQPLHPNLSIEPVKETINLSSKTETITFDQFYSAYPKHVKRVDAEKSWKKLNGMDKSIIMEDIAKRKLSLQWQDKQFIPAPSAYLNGKRWEDEIIYDENNHHEPTRKRIVL